MIQSESFLHRVRVIQTTSHFVTSCKQYAISGRDVVTSFLFSSFHRLLLPKPDIRCGPAPVQSRESNLSEHARVSGTRMTINRRRKENVSGQWVITAAQINIRMGRRMRAEAVHRLDLQDRAGAGWRVRAVGYSSLFACTKGFPWGDSRLYRKGNEARFGRK